MCPSVIFPRISSFLYYLAFLQTYKKCTLHLLHTTVASLLFSLKVFKFSLKVPLILLLFQPASSSAYPFLNVWMSASFFSLDVKGKNAKIPKGNCQLPSHLKFSLQFHSKAQVLPVPNTEEGKAYENLSK